MVHYTHSPHVKVILQRSIPMVCLWTLLLVFTHTIQAQVPTLNTIDDQVVNQGAVVQLWANGPQYYTWSPSSNIANIVQGTNSSTATTTPMQQSMYFIVTGYGAGNNLVINGDFSQGNSGFTSSYSYTTNLWPEGTYYIGTNANNYHTGFSGAHDHTSGNGNYMIINGATNPGTIVWSQTVNVIPNTDYAFSTWVTTVAQSPWAQLQFRINSVQIGDIFSAPSSYSSTNTWQNFYQVWNSGNNTQATISIINQNTTGGGNDFGLDDISFEQLYGIRDTIQVLVRHDIDTTVCDNELPFDWRGVTFTGPGTIDTILINPNGVDDAVIMHLNVRQHTTNTIYEEIPENELPYTFNDVIFTNDTNDAIITLTNSAGCDSIIHFSLLVHRNHSVSLDTTLCDYQTPFYWLGIPFEESVSFTDSLQDIHGADSVVSLHLVVIPTTLEIIANTADFCESGSASIEANTPMENYLWSTGETLQSIFVTTPGLYAVTASQEHCSKSAQVSIEPCTYDLLLPNAISPGRPDGLNDYFLIPEQHIQQMSSLNFSIAIVDKWGSTVFYSTDPHFKWDGKVNSKLFTNVLYNYVIKYHTRLGDEKVLKGSLWVL